ncbi:FMN-dependent NADH-azoreductase [Actinacidiphila acididurans]|uniref:FMN dependent NADH:quinone oxidoreductase n=1 Tax=Actinacidiphila acididurans TaxID=2784346 RepID=A0ABS2TX13_9ACTN|nr:NAD(P)H-dependent oxidoreductase [Actinacidiphila acididurans]MBM9507885.1 NAD(P)H-dependent oxidoreductase [Actinacidiphila acididurans]
MFYLLHIDATTFDVKSISRQVARSFRDVWEGDVVYRDLAATPVPHLTAAGVSARLTDASLHTPAEAEALLVQDELIEEFLGASAYLFTVPMYNYTMPSSFKAWLDQVVVVGRTIAFPDGPPAAGRPAVVVSARGGSYEQGSPNYGMDHLLPTLETVLGPRTLGLAIHAIKPQLTLAPVVPAMAELIDLHTASLADSHAEARRLAQELVAAPRGAA